MKKIERCKDKLIIYVFLSLVDLVHFVVVTVKSFVCVCLCVCVRVCVM